MTDDCNPQIENGYLRLANELVDAIGRTYFTPTQSKCVWCIIRYTYGYNRKRAKIRKEQWVGFTDMAATHIYRALRELKARNVVTHNGHSWALNKKYNQWLGREEGVTRIDHQCTNLVTRGDQYGSLIGDQTWSPYPYKQYKDNFKDRRRLLEGARAQPGDKKLPPCKKCLHEYAVGYTGMKKGICLDCRQEE